MCLYHRFYCPWDIPFQTQLIRLVLQNEKMEYINFPFMNKKNQNKIDDDTNEEIEDDDAQSCIRSNSKLKFRSMRYKGSHSSTTTTIGRNDNYLPKNYNQMKNDDQEQTQQQQQLSTYANINISKRKMENGNINNEVVDGLT